MNDTFLTYLSDNVHEVIINLRLAASSCETKVVDNNLVFDWNLINNELKNISG